MILAEYTLDHIILRETLRHAPWTTVTWEESHTGENGQRQFIAWVESEDMAAFEHGIESDPSVRNPVVQTELGDRRLYRFDLTEKAEETDIMPLLMEVGGVHRHLVATSDGWLNRTQFPDRAAFERVHQFCRDHDIQFTFHRILEERGRDGGDPLHLTEAQREVLTAAVESGYLDIPRQCSLAELGATLDISQSAASERFRRGTKNLIQHALLNG